VGEYVATHISEFISLVSKAKKEAKEPSKSLGSGPITIELTWDSMPDVDLHVF
jgi:hypothetical protein